MARKKANLDSTIAPLPVDGEPPVLEVVPPTSAEPVMNTYEPVTINNYNIVDLKNTLDDALKRALSRPEAYSQIHLHTDIRLALGYAGVVVAGLTGLYSWKISFEESKLGVLVGVVAYMILSGLQMAYAYLVEGNTVFVGKRKSLAKRIETERLTTASKTTNPIPKSPSPSSAPISNLLTAYPRATSSYLPPHYNLTMEYALTANGGKSLIRQSKLEDERCYADFFDAKGNLDEARFVVWVTALVVKVESEQQ